MQEYKDTLEEIKKICNIRFDRDMAEYFGVTQKTYSQWKNGHQYISLSHIDYFRRRMQKIVTEGRYAELLRLIDELRSITIEKKSKTKKTRNAIITNNTIETSLLLSNANSDSTHMQLDTESYYNHCFMFDFCFAVIGVIIFMIVMLHTFNTNNLKRVYLLTYFGLLCVVAVKTAKEHEFLIMSSNGKTMDFIKNGEALYCSLLVFGVFLLMIGVVFNSNVFKLLSCVYGILFLFFQKKIMKNTYQHT